MNILAMTDEALQDRRARLLAEADDITDELVYYRDYGPTLWETYTKEEREERMSAAAIALKSAMTDYKDDMREQLNAHNVFLQMIEDRGRG